MKPMLPIAALTGMCLLLGACQPSTSPSGRLYAPGRRLVLTVWDEMWDRGIGVSTHSISSTTPDGKTVEEVIERVETKRSSVRYGTELELPMDVAASWRLGCVDVSMKVARLASSDAYKDDKGVIREVATGTPSGDEATSKESQDEMQRNLRDVSLHATVDAMGEVVAFDVRGGSLALGQDNSLWSRDGGISHYQCFGALSDAAAYLPPADVELSQAWHIVRKKVFPYHAYGFYMLTNGCGYSREQSTCEAVSVEPTSDGRIVTVRITGRRVPMHPEPGQPRRVDYMETGGELKFNLDTREVISLHVEDKLHMLTKEDRKYISATFATNITLKRR